jgi:signal transduction histidine kinase
MYLALGYAYGPILLALFVAIYGVAYRVPLRRGLAGIGVLSVGAMLVIGAGVMAGSRAWTEFISTAAWLAIPTAVGIAVQARRDAAAHVRAEQARRAVSEERLRLAQEVHDVAGHGFAVIAMQAGVALRVLDRDPASARAALEGIRAASREALDSLRAEVEAMGQPVAPLRPTSGLADLPALLSRIRSSGLPVTLVAPVGPVDLPPELDRTAYRIIQEALTNVLRHAGAHATARVSVERGPDQVDLLVVDTGRGGPPARRDGRGIDGMRARAEALGGTLAAGPGRQGGFEVRASIPAPGGGAR